MLYHHDSRSYEEAASAAATRAKAKMEELIAKGLNNARGVMDKIMTEVPKDRVVRAPGLNFFEDDGLKVRVGGGDEVEVLHRNALTQVAERADVPMQYVNTLQAKGEWGRALLARNFRETFEHAPDARYLIRSYKNEMRACLSNKFRRLDSRPIAEQLALAAEKIGAVPIEGYGTDTRVALKFLLPRVFEPAPNEVVCFGAAWQNSDYGNGAHSVRIFMLRLWCTNYGITDECLREVHLGSRLSEDEAWSNRTMELDTKRSASMVYDALHSALSPEKVNHQLALIKKANDEKIDGKDVAVWLKKQLGAGDAKKAIEIYNSADVENLPPGNTKWRMSNAVSWMAGQTEDKEKALDLMKVAGAALAA